MTLNLQSMAVDEITALNSMVTDPRTSLSQATLKQ